MALEDDLALFFVAYVYFIPVEVRYVGRGYHTAKKEVHEGTELAKLWEMFIIEYPAHQGKKKFSWYNRVLYPIISKMFPRLDLEKNHRRPVRPELTEGVRPSTS